MSTHRSPRFSLSRPEDSQHYQRVRELLCQPPCSGIPREPDCLLPHIFLGNQNNAESLRTLRKYGITHVLNCAGYKGPRPEPHSSPYEGLNIGYLEFLAEDEDTYDITQHFKEAFNFLDRVKKEGGVALVHCAMGINRSAAVCAAYMMVTTHSTLMQVLRVLKRKRRIVLSNHGFQRQLVRFARSRGLLDDLEPPKDEFQREKEKIEEALRRHQLDLVPSGASGLYEDAPRRARPLSDSYDDEFASRRYHQPLDGASEPLYTYTSVGKRTEIHVPVPRDVPMPAGNSIFERYLLKQRAYIQKH